MKRIIFLDLPFTAKVIFPSIAKSSKTESEGGRHIPKRIFASLEVHCSSSLSGAYFIATLLTGSIGPLSEYHVSRRMYCF